MQIDPFAVVIGLAAFDDQLLVFDRDAQILFGKTGHSQGYPVRIFAVLLDIERRIAIAGGFRRAFDQPFKLFKPQQKRVRTKGKFRHLSVLR
jgi:hypothetical protein